MPLEPKEIRISGEINPLRVHATEFQAPRVGSPGLFVPRIQLGGSFYGSPIRGLELGGQMRFTHLSWADPNAKGVLNFPDDGELLVVGGVGARGNLRFTERLTGSVLMEFNLTEVVQAVYACRTCVDGASGRFRFERIDKALFVLPSFSANLSYKFNNYIGVYAFVGGQLGVTNTGFDNDFSKLDKSTLRPMLVFSVGGGVEARYEHIYLRVGPYYPFDFIDHQEFGLAFSAQAGLVL